MDKFIFSNLNEMQQKAVLSKSQYILVTAGAGSGKTRVLTERILNLIENEQVAPENILAITFTNKASSVMKDRLSEKGLFVPGLWISTFHSSAVRILRENAHLIDGHDSNFTIFDESDKNKLIAKILKDYHCENDNFKKKLSYHISKFKNKLQTLSFYAIENCYETDIEEICKFIEIYENEMKNNNAFDFDDLLQKAYKLLMSNESVRNYYAKKFRHILIDEFQDTNEIQYDFVKLLSSGGASVFVVGDEDQCIYSWRGANYRNIANFTKDFKNVEIIKLEQNYRSTKQIIAGANKIISKNVERIDKKLWTNNGDGLKIEFKKCYNEEKEAEFVASTIFELKTRLNENLNNIAVLVRLNSLTRNIEEKLLNYGLNYKVYGGMKFYERMEIKNFLAYLKVLNNPKDDVSFAKIANFPKRGIGDVSLKNLKELDLSHSMLENLLNLNKFMLKGATYNKLLSLRTLFENLMQKKNELSIYDLCLFIMKATNINEFLNVDEEDKNRMLNLEQLVLSIKEFCKNNENATLNDYLQSVTLVSDMDNYNEGDDCVTIATVHASKGLEFGCVFVIGLEDGIFPLRRQDEECDEEEERRLMYVAITRSERRLYLTCARSRFLYGYTKSQIVSPFIKDLGFETSDFGGGYDNFDNGARQNSYGYNSSESFARSNYYGNNSYKNTRGYENSTGYDERYSQNYSSDKQNFQGKNASDIEIVQSSENNFCVGDKVLHKTFGEGVIVSVNGDFGKIAFKGVGVKELMLTIAPISKI